MKITKSDVYQAAGDKGISVLDALSMMQAVAVKMNDESILESLCAIKYELLFGADQ